MTIPSRESIRNFFFLPREALAKPNRLFFLDGFRSMALFFMVFTHGIKNWISPASETPFSLFLKTFITRIPAPSFFFLVGTSYILSRNARLRRGTSRNRAYLFYVRRSVVLFILAYVYKMVDVLFGARWEDIRWTIDVLNIIAVSLFLVSTWDFLTWRYRWNRFSYLPAALFMIWISPYMFLLPLPSWLSQQAAWYIQGMPPNAFFTVFPFSGYSFFGAFIVERLLQGDAEKPFLNLPPLFGGIVGLMTLALVLSRLFDPLGTLAATTVFYMQAFALLLAGTLACNYFQKFVGFGPLLIVGTHTMIGYWVHAKIVFIYYKRYIGVSDWNTMVWLLIKTYLATFFILLIFDRLKRNWIARKRKAAGFAAPKNIDKTNKKEYFS